MGMKYSIKKAFLENYQMYLFLLPTILIILVFKYIPMYGLKIGFIDYLPGMKFEDCDWRGFYWFHKFLTSPKIFQLIVNTLWLNIYSLLVSFPIPIILALMLNQLTSERYKRFVQTVTYAPHFISTVVLVGMMFVFLSPSTGVVNKLVEYMGFKPIFFMGSSSMFSSLYVLSGVWQEAGFGAIIYLAALAGVNPELYEAATVDGASRFAKIVHIDIPCIMPTVVIMLIMTVGNLMNVGFEKVFLMQTDLNRQASDVIATYVYDVGIKQMQYSYSTAINTFVSVINMILLLIVNKVASVLSDTSLF